MIKIITFIYLFFPALLWAQQSYIFSPVELEIDKIAKLYKEDSAKAFQQIDILLAKTQNDTPEIKSLLLAYDCALRAKLLSTLAKTRLNDLNLLAEDYSSNASVRASTALCEAEIFRAHQKDDQYKRALLKAYIFAKKSKNPAIRYWVSVNAQDIFMELNNYKAVENALLIGLEVAINNKDQKRLATTHQLIAESYLLAEKFTLALKHNQAALEAIVHIENKQYLANVYTGRAFILAKLGQLDSAISFHKKALVLSKKNKDHREVQFINLDISYVLLLQKNHLLAKSLINKVNEYATQYDDEYLLYQSQMLLSFQQLFDKKSVKEAKENFHQAIEYFQKNNYQSDIIHSLQQQGEISKLTKNFQISNQSNTQYFQLIKKISIDKKLENETLTKQAYEQIRKDDRVISENKQLKIKLKNNQLTQNIQVMMIVISLLSMTLFIILMKYVFVVWKKHQYKKEEINRQRYYDPLTQAFNRRYFNEIICSSIIDNCQAQKTTHLLLIDIDHFKSFNDTYGHSAGDTVLKELVSNLKGDSRVLDHIVRMGGEEFILTLTPNDNLPIDTVVERILKQVSNAQIIIEDIPQSITISIGFVAIDNASNNAHIESFINLADKALYVAKDSGRNRAVGIKNLKCTPDKIDNLLVASENSLLSLTKVNPSK
jgi:diguanylate cyclase (GGDEF)-like protein